MELLWGYHSSPWAGYSLSNSRRRHLLRRGWWRWGRQDRLSICNLVVDNVMTFRRCSWGEWKRTKE